VVYYAAAEQIGNTELKDQAFEPWTIESGEYIALPVRQWREKTDTIKDVFCLLMQDARADKSKPCVEWYKTDDEMLCMIKTTSN
jgi:DNA-binding cell septation regulator SpoVG